jgi:hypothetical protein
VFILLLIKFIWFHLKSEVIFPILFPFILMMKYLLLLIPFDGLGQAFKASLGDRPVKLILNTHYHRDHTGCNYLFPTADVYAHPADIPAMVSREAPSYNYYGFDRHADAGTKSVFAGDNVLDTMAALVQ